MTHFIFGRSGNGKTCKIKQMIYENCKSGKRSYLIVPEQQAYITERSFLPPLQKQPYNSGTLTIAGFTRLAREVFECVGGIEEAKITRSIRTLLMWRAMKQLYGTMREYTGMPDRKTAAMMLAACDELRDSGISASDVEKVACGLGDSPFARKLSDVSAAYSSFGELALTNFGGDSGDSVSILSEKLKDNRYFVGADVFIDSFTSFTKPELDVIAELMKQADNVWISLGIASPSDSGMQFTEIKDTYLSIRATADRIGIQTKSNLSEKERNIENHRTDSEMLKYLGTHIWDFTSAPFAKFEKIPDDVQFIRAPTVYAEAEAAALKLLEFKKSGIEFGEMAVIVRNTENLRGVIDATLERFGIPCFLSERTDISAKPISRLITSALNVSLMNYRQSDVLTLIKTGLCGISKRDGDLFEDYCNKWNINGSQFTKIWSMNPDGYTDVLSPRGKEILATANTVREKIISPISELSIAMKASSNVRDLCFALFNYLEKLNIRATLSAEAESELAADNVKSAGETLRLYDFINDCLVTLCNIFNDTQMTAEEFSTALQILLAETDIGSVPALHDCVVIGSAATLRVENVKAAVVMGLVEGEFPASSASSGIFGTDDRKILAEHNLKLNDTDQINASNELFYFYRAITVPSEKLVLSMPNTRIGSKSNLPSVAYLRALAIFPTVPEEYYAPQVKISAYDETVSRFSTTLSQEVDSKIMRQILGDTLKLSSSKLSAFLKCPYKFYTEYLLSLRDGDEATVSHSDSGTFIHYLMENFLRENCMDEKVKELTPEQISEIADRLTEKYTSRLIPDRNPRILHQFARLKKLALGLMNSSYSEIKNGSFTPIGLEKKIGGCADSLEPIEYPVYDTADTPKVAVMGKIDRIDLYKNGNNYYARIIDYKTSGNYDISMEKILNPAPAKDECDEETQKTEYEPQMLIYLFTVINNRLSIAGEGKTLKPAGAAYLYVDESAGECGHKGIFTNDPTVQNAFCPNDDGKILLGVTQDRYKEQRLFDDEKIKKVETVIGEKIKIAAAEIYSGQAARHGSTDACKYCKLKATCPVFVKEKN